MSWAVLTVFAVVTLLSAVLLRVAVRLFARGADNGWDNAFVYVLALTAIFYFPVRWILGAHSIPLLFLIPPIVVLGQVLTMKVVYEVSYKRAFGVSLVHNVVSSLFFGTLSFAIAVIAAYVMYGRIISDPMILVRIICKLIGVPCPFDLS